MKQLNHSALRINVGFLLHQDVGYSRKFEFNEKSVQIADDLDVCDLNGEVKYTRTAQGLYGNGMLHAHASIECVRCLNPFDQQLTIEVNDLFTYPPGKDTDPLLTIPQTGVLDMTDLVKEYLLLDIPIQPVCGTECAGLCVVCGSPREDGSCDHPEENIDPRMAILQSLLSKS